MVIKRLFSWEYMGKYRRQKLLDLGKSLIGQMLNYPDVSFKIKTFEIKFNKGYHELWVEG